MSGGSGKGGKKGKGGSGADYENVLKGLVLEGLYALVEKKVTVKCRAKDNDIVKKAIDAAKKEYSEKLKGREVEVVIDEKDKLPEES